MSYHEEDGQVTLTMSREEFQVLEESLRAYCMFCWRNPREITELLHRLNQGNPHPRLGFSGAERG